MINQPRILVLFGSIFFCLCYSFSQQKNGSTYRLLLSKYIRAQSYYDSATAIGSSINYSEEKERYYNELALLHFRSLLKQIPEVKDYDSLHFQTAFKLGELEHFMERFREALEGYRTAITVVQNGNIPDSLLFKPYLYSGILYYSTNQYDSATLAFKKADEVQQQYGYRLEESERLFNTFGALYYEKGDYQQARNYFQKALELLPKHHVYYNELSVNYNINLAQIYFRLEEYDQANTIYQALLKNSVSARNEIYHNLGLIHLYLGAPHRSLEYFSKVDYRTNKVIWLYNNVGEAYLALDNNDSARFYFEKALATSESLGSNTDRIADGVAHRNLGQLEAELKQPMNALQFYQQALHRFYPAFKDSSVKNDPENFTGAFSYINLFNTLVAKADAFHQLYLQTLSIEWAKEELEAYQSAFKLVAYVERTYESDEARLFLNKSKYIIHSKPIDIAFELFRKTNDDSYMDALYVFDQQNKASVLALKKQMTGRFSTVDASLSSKERKIRSDITTLSLRVIQSRDSSVTAGLNKRIRDLEIELGRVQDRLRDSSGHLLQEVPTIGALQKNLLDDKTAILSFHLSEDKLTTILISKTDKGCSQQPLPEDFHELMTSYIRLQQQPDNDSAASLGKRIHSLLFNVPLNKAERLIIIPDDELHYLSFESLQDQNGSYLIERYSVQYQYATTLLHRQEIDLSDHTTLAFAPFASASYQDSSLKLDRLPNSQQEVEMLKGMKYLDEAAAKEKFLSEVPKFRVIHLATHAVVNSEDEQLSFISFHPGQNRLPQDFLLYSGEISGLHLEATELVILSACETGSGSLIKGEGVMSLSRAFSYAGCDNIITSLWNANDFSTAYLTGKLHYYLDKDYTIDKALHQAKLDYLQDPKINPRLKHPFYWSHLVFVGDYEAETSGSPLWVWLIAPVLIVVSLLLIRRAKARKLL